MLILGNEAFVKHSANLLMQWIFSEVPILRVISWHLLSWMTSPGNKQWLAIILASKTLKDQLCNQTCSCRWPSAIRCHIWCVLGEFKVWNMFCLSHSNVSWNFIFNEVLLINWHYSSWPKLHFIDQMTIFKQNNGTLINLLAINSRSLRLWLDNPCETSLHIIRNIYMQQDTSNGFLIPCGRTVTWPVFP